MAQKPEIQYIGQFYVHGSEAKKLAEKKEQKKAKTQLPQHRFERVKKIYVDPLAIAGLMMAAVLLVSMVLGALTLETAWQNLEKAEQYVYELQTQNAVLTASFRSGYQLEEIRGAALALGMIPAEEAAVMKLPVTVPQPQQEPGFVDNMIWFLEGLFA